MVYTKYQSTLYDKISSGPTQVSLGMFLPEIAALRYVVRGTRLIRMSDLNSMLLQPLSIYGVWQYPIDWEDTAADTKQWRWLQDLRVVSVVHERYIKLGDPKMVSKLIGGKLVVPAYLT